MTDTGGKPITGRHFLFGIIAFFALIFVANGILLYFALTSWSGLEVESSYEAGRSFNKEVDAARAQAALGWQVDATADRAADGTATIRLVAKDANAVALSGLDFAGRLSRPTMRADDKSFKLAETGAGVYTTTIDGVAAGQWDLIVEAHDRDDRVYRSRNRLVFNE